MAERTNLGICGASRQGVRPLPPRGTTAPMHEGPEQPEVSALKSRGPPARPRLRAGPASPAAPAPASCGVTPGAATGPPAGSTSGLAWRQLDREAGRAKRSAALRTAEGQPRPPAESRGASCAPRPGSATFPLSSASPRPATKSAAPAAGEFPDSPHCVCEGRAGSRTLAPASPA
uniref:Uncharacterized protein n=1 Tax=Mustela putorius furo TaxID=9669 RepID=M3XN63_MUSPF